MQVNKNKKIKNKKNKKWYDIECINKKNKARLLARRKHIKPLDEILKEEHKNPKYIDNYVDLNRLKNKIKLKKIIQTFGRIWKIWKNLGEKEKRRTLCKC